MSLPISPHPHPLPPLMLSWCLLAAASSLSSSLARTVPVSYVPLFLSCMCLLPSVSSCLLSLFLHMHPAFVCLHVSPPRCCLLMSVSMSLDVQSLCLPIIFLLEMSLCLFVPAPLA